jgi:hypothetical protein
MKDELRSPAFAELRRGMPALTQAAVATVEPRCAENAVANAEKKAVKTVKWVFAILRSEPAVAQSVPTKMRGGDFTDFALILRMGIWRGGGWKGRIMKAELRNCKRSANGVVKPAQLRVARLSNQTPSQSVAVSRSDYLDVPEQITFGILGRNLLQQ